MATVTAERKEAFLRAEAPAWAGEAPASSEEASVVAGVSAVHILAADSVVHMVAVGTDRRTT